MQYFVLKTNDAYKIEKIPNYCYLIEDKWDDWFHYSTMYDLVVIDNASLRHDIGKVKIGQFKMEEDQRRPDIPTYFSKLDKRFFSVGQDSDYYDNIKNLGDEFRINILEQLKDIAYNEKLFQKCKKENVTKISLLRDFSVETIKGQFRRIANGGAKLTPYNFEYVSFSTDDKYPPMALQFDITPESFPPTNIHVIIGRNGVGKTHLINNMIQSIVNIRDKRLEYGTTRFINDSNDADEHFARVIFVSFSAFDDYKIKSRSKKLIKIGLPSTGTIDKVDSKSSNQLTDHFVNAFFACVCGPQNKLLKQSLETLTSDPMFSEADILRFCNKEGCIKDDVANVFSKLSSGHKIILLSITKLVEKVQEKTLIFLDEPEGHLHPPLLSAFIRALSELLTNKNGVAIIATHSPVILQEVPRKCVWKLRRTGRYCNADRLTIESFGEDITSLTSEVFGLEITDSGFHSLLKRMVDKYDDYEEIIEKCDGEIGTEGRALIKAMLVTKYEEESNDD